MVHARNLGPRGVFGFEAAGITMEKRHPAARRGRRGGSG
jgi:hypothetical protein